MSETERTTTGSGDTGGLTTDARDLVLAIDTATEWLALSVVQVEPRRGLPFGPRVENASELASHLAEVGREHSSALIPAIDALLATAGAEPARVAGIVVGVGPGSYTGVRIGVATAKALARAWSAPVVGVGTLLALMPADLEVGATGLGVLDARRGNVYAQAAVRLPGPHARYAPEGEPVKVPRDSLSARFPGLREGGDRPDAAALARSAVAGGTLDVYYL